MYINNKDGFNEYENLTKTQSDLFIFTDRKNPFIN